ncbi:MAG TPA: TrmH family RNA methyltransferase [Candidatus Absconditabacterales bacterium]|nr:TrmH family RNA methyltransferase [Candidatus Absconditabacterales bacterium]
MKKNVILLENIRSAYNVGNIIRTADALGWDVWLSGYTPHPSEQPKVVKTSLGAEETVGIKRFDSTKDAIDFARNEKFMILAGELDKKAVSLSDFQTLDSSLHSEGQVKKMLVLGNEVDGVLDFTLKLVDNIVYIPMRGVKESLNVGQSAAIFMRELGK